MPCVCAVCGHRVRLFLERLAAGTRVVVCSACYNERNLARRNPTPKA